MTWIAIVAAVADSGVIGHHNQLPWHLPADLRRFRRLTMGYPLIMGRKTFASIGRPLPGRTSIVLSRQPISQLPDVRWAASWDQAVRHAQQQAASQVMVIGGRSVYERALPEADVLYLTRVHAPVVGDVYFPPVDWHQWQLAEQERHEADERNELPFSFETYHRRSTSSG